MFARMKPIVWALIPYDIQGGHLTADTYDNDRTKAELASTFHQLGLPWIWQPVVLGSIDDIVAQLATSLARRPTVAFNLCDGLDGDGVPGLSFVSALEQAGIPFTGSDPRFYETSTYKLRMKRLFRERGIETAPWEVLPSTGPVEGVCARLGVPLIVKPDVSYGSYGISLRSKVGTDAEIETRRDELHRHELATMLIDGDIFAERYLAGDEYTIFTGGYRDDPGQVWTLPPARRCFADSIPAHERFLTYDRYWGYYREESAPEGGEAFYRYELVEGELADELVELARQAFCAAHGHGYARVDVRRDTVSGKLSVLEVNANCGLSGDDQTSTGSILQQMGWNLPGLFLRIIRQTLERHGAPAGVT
jgi:D-alanine-D-alanine ligase